MLQADNRPTSGVSGHWEISRNSVSAVRERERLEQGRGVRGAGGGVTKPDVIRVEAAQLLSLLKGCGELPEGVEAQSTAMLGKWASACVTYPSNIGLSGSKSVYVESVPIKQSVVSSVFKARHRGDKKRAVRPIVSEHRANRAIAVFWPVCSGSVMSTVVWRLALDLWAL
ncbi:hypothetical protein J6590_011442 [Homalodisca vitripennis]|nr:hypothetical protein J6590_011442 [Homalodisca vitripennis]